MQFVKALLLVLLLLRIGDLNQLLAPSIRLFQSTNAERPDYRHCQSARRGPVALPEVLHRTREFPSGDLHLAHRADLRSCELVQVSRSAYYADRRRLPTRGMQRNGGGT
jgi:hypothetical protein